MMRHRDLGDVLSAMAHRERDSANRRDLYEAADRLYDLADEEDRLAREALRSSPGEHDCFSCWRDDPDNSNKLAPAFACPHCRSDNCMKGTAHVNECDSRLTSHGHIETMQRHDSMLDVPW